VETTKARMATKTEPTFRRGRHLFFAMIGLAHGPIVAGTGVATLWLTNATTWSAELMALAAMMQLSFAALVAWLAFSVFDTHSGVTILPKRWRDLGAELATLFLVLEACSVWVVWRDPATHWDRSEGWFAIFSNDHGGLQLGWAVFMLAYPIAEEIVYRALLLRALEGYMGQISALVVQGALFELVHVCVYGYGDFTGVWFIIGFMLGAVFQRTRSLAVPTFLHAAHNVVYFGAVWWFGR
jgi:membrane protease YdiL (CAAX protease family)